ncbi:MAG: AraC family transcriptional regulator [Psychroserpens sp.]|uniref:helix-turn-helix transcriptional regulator n=1 Tax=Psychroserpens sp. TaxID=2020870 RepID=UPI00300383D6
MILKHQTIDIFEKMIFETAVVKPPFKSLHQLDNEACFLYILEGSNNHYSEEGHINHNKDEAVLMKCGNFIFDVIPNETTGKGGIVAIHFYPEVLKKIYENDVPDFLKSKKQIPFHSNMALVKSSLLIKKYIEGLIFYFENPTLVTEELMILKLKEIILLLLNTEDAPAIIEIMHNLFSPREYSFKDIIESHIFSPISTSNLAELTNYSLASFKREFKKIYDDSPANYIKNKRLEKAAKLLVVSNIPISSIAYDCLFNDVAHFSSSFKTKYKQTPSQFRLSQ